MNTRKLLLAGAAIVAFSGLGAGSAQAATDTLDITAEIVAPIAANCTVTLDFGDIDPGVAGGTVTLDTANTATAGGDTASLGGTANGSCDITGQPSLVYNVDIPATTVDDVGAGAPMAVNNFTFLSANGGGELAADGVNTATLDGSGDDTLTIGADLVVGAAQVAGTYPGTATLEVLYD